MKKTQFIPAFITSIEGNKYPIYSDGTQEAINECFYDEDFKNPVFVYKCVLFYECEGSYHINLWNGSHQFPEIQKMTDFIDTADL